VRLAAGRSFRGRRRRAPLADEIKPLIPALEAQLANVAPVLDEGMILLAGIFDRLAQLAVEPR
jgi:hypothetical protein